MSQENVELSHQVMDAFNRRDLGAYLALTDSPCFLTSWGVRVSTDSQRGNGCPNSLAQVG
jgi:hypothetical protein